MDYLNFIKKIDNSIKGFYLFQGEEMFLADNTINKMIEILINNEFKDLNVIKFHSLNKFEDSDLKRIEEEINQSGFFLQKKIVIISNPESIYKNIEGWLDKYGETTQNIIIIKYNPQNINKNYSLYKKLLKFDRIINFEKVSQASFKKWILKNIEENEKKITPDALEYIIENSDYFNEVDNYNLYNVLFEIKKLIDIEEKIINLDHVLELMTPSIKSNIFSLTNSIGELNYKKFSREYNNLKKNGAEDIYILAMLIRFFKNLYFIKSEYEYRNFDAMNSLKIKKFEYNKIKSCINLFDIETIEECISKLNNIDFKIKNLKIDFFNEITDALYSIFFRS